MKTPKILVGAAPVALALFLSGCSQPVTPAVVVGGITLGAQTLVCAAQSVGNDVAENPPANPLQIALDLAKNCGLDVEEIVALFGATHPVAVAAAQNAGQVHAAALARKAVRAQSATSASAAQTQWQEARALLQSKYGWQ